MTEPTKEKNDFTSAVEAVSNTNLTPDQKFQLLMAGINGGCFQSEPTSIHLQQITGDAYVFNNKGNVDLNLGGGSLLFSRFSCTPNRVAVPWGETSSL